ncbi:MAG TPA: hypothetical protein VFG10_09900 [Saprospiraceae bacterium]|nr:hypothetical protein [Saprospiraceae bacterium]
MKFSLSFLLICFFLPVFSQLEEPCGGWPDHAQDSINRASYGHVVLSSMSNIQNVPVMAVDGNNNTKAKTLHEQNPYIQIDLGERFHVPFVRIISEDTIPQFYIFTSEYPIDPSRSLSDLLTDPSIFSNQVFNYNSGNNFYLNEEIRYVRLQFGDSRILNISEFYIPGDGLDDEICGNHIDDNCDGKIDCDDNECGVRIFNVSVIDASCPICNDGEISIQAFGHNKVYSIDGGVTYSNACYNSFENMCYYSGLIPGVYHIKVKNSVSGCETTYPDPVVVRSPPPGSDGPCENGGFEHGNFDSWTGGLGVHNPRTVAKFNNNNTDFLLNDRHTIINTATFQDEYVAILNGNYPGLGSYIAKLGNNDTEGQAERLKYCFTVDEQNKDFNFVYAVALNAYHDNNELNSFFRWIIYPDNGLPPDPFTIIEYKNIVADVDNDYFSSLEIPNSAGHQILVYTGWACQNYDLSDHLGENLCIEFITADCSEGAHFGYAYIDGLCSSSEDLCPVVEIESNDIICQDQDLPISVNGGGYVRYKWKISKLNSSGNPFESMETDVIIGNNATIDHLIAFYADNSSYELSCDDKIKAELTVYNDCCSSTASKDIQLDCAIYDINYCNVIIDCLSDETQRIIGTNDCDDCEYIWSPSQFLILDDLKFPLVTAQNFANAFDQTYNVTVTSPEGCIWNESIVFQNDHSYTITLKPNLSYCDYSMDIIIEFEDEIEESLIDVSAFDILTAPPFTSYNPVFIENESTGFKKIYRVSDISRAEATRIKAFVQVNPEGQNCTTEDMCMKSALNNIVAKSPWSDPWTVYLPNSFQPNGDGFADVWFPTFFGTGPNCEEILQNGDNNHVYRAKLTIYFRGATQFEIETSADPNETLGVDQLKLSWDGNAPNGKQMASDTYTAKLEIWSCHNGPQCPPEGIDCVYPDYFCSADPYSFVIWDITLSR